MHTPPSEWRPARYPKFHGHPVTWYPALVATPGRTRARIERAMNRPGLLLLPNRRNRQETN